jgi:hypothetical protein
MDYYKVNFLASSGRGRNRCFYSSGDYDSASDLNSKSPSTKFAEQDSLSARVATTQKGETNRPE